MAIKYSKKDEVAEVVKEEVKEAPKAEPKKVEVPKERKWVYRSNWECTLVVKNSHKDGVRAADGQLLNVINFPPIKVKFPNGWFTVTDDVAKSRGLRSSEDLVSLIESHPDFGKRFWLVQSPDFAASKEDLELMKKAGKSNTEVVHGFRKV